MQVDTMEHGRSSLTVESLILSELANAPLAPAELKRRVAKKLKKLSAAAWKVAIDQLVAAQRIHGRMKLGKGGKPTKKVENYALGAPPPPPPPPEELARAKILELLQRAAPSAAELKKRVRASVPGLTVKAFEVVAAGLADEKKLYVRRQRGKDGKPKKTIERYTLEAPSPAEFLGPVLSAWELAKDLASEEGLDEQTLGAALLSELGLVAAQSSGASEREIVLRALRDLVAREGHGSLIAMRKLRAAVKLPRSRFDAVLLALSAEDTIILHHHDYVASLSAEEREALVVDDYGNHYVGVAIRGGA